MTRTLPPHRLVALNTATASENKIHDDEVAGRLGFTGGLVPGVEVYGYLCHAPLELWGPSWLEGGTATVRFDQPVYDGEEVEIRAELDDDGVLVADAHTTAGHRARLAAALTDGDAPLHILVPSIDRAERPAARPAASPELFADHLTLATLSVRCDEADHERYLHEISDPDSPTTALGTCHPGWVLRRANEVLVTSVRLGPWIHVGSTVQHLRPLPRGTELEVRGRVREAHEHKGHRFVDLDVVISDADGAAVVIDHRAIYEPRQVRADLD
jgi:acyl dehydratase